MRKEGVAKKLARPRPGSLGVVKALVTKEGNIVAREEDIANELSEYRQEVFTGKKVDKEALKEWLRKSQVNMGSGLHFKHRKALESPTRKH